MKSAKRYLTSTCGSMEMDFMRLAAGRFAAFSMVAAFVFCLLIGIDAAPAVAAGKDVPGHEFKNPYIGGTQLPAGGGEPGKAYRELVDAAGKKDYAQICRLVTTESKSLGECLKDQNAAKGIAYFMGDPKRQKILNGYAKGDEATLDVFYWHTDAPDSYASVRMKKNGEKWIWAGFSASGSGEMSASASSTIDLGASTGTLATAKSDPKECPMLGEWDFVGKDDKGGKWTGVINIRIEDSDVACDVNIEGPDFGNGSGGSCPCRAGQKDFSFIMGGNSFTAVLSKDGRTLANGKWTLEENSFMTFPKVTGTWSAKAKGK